MATFRIQKDPDAVLDYTIDWSSWLPLGDVVVDSSWIITPGLTKVQESNDGTSATVWLSGGKIGTTYFATNRIITGTLPARHEDRTIQIDVVSR